MERDSLIKIREFLVNINKLDIPIQDKIEAYLNISLLVDPDNYDKHIEILKREFNEDLKWKTKGK